MMKQMQLQIFNWNNKEEIDLDQVVNDVVKSIEAS